METSQFFVSTVVPVYNGEVFLAQAVDSIRRQAYEPLEIIIVDDGSTDNTASIAKGLGGNVRYIYQPNRGPAAARNAGIKLAQGDVIAFLDVDDLWPAGKLKLQLAHLFSQPTLDLVLGHVQCMKLSGMEDNKPIFEPFAEPFFTFLFGAVLCRKSVFDKVGLLDETLYTSEDVDWFMRAKDRKVSRVTLKQITLMYCLHQHNMTRFQDIRRRDFVHVLKKSLDRRRKQAV